MNPSTGKFKIDANLVKLLILGSEADQNHALLDGLKTKFNYDFAKPPSDLVYADYLNIVDYIRQKLHANKTEDEGYAALGKALSKGYRHGDVGRVLLKTIQFAKPEDLLEMIVQTLRSNNFNITYEVETARPHYGRVKVTGMLVNPHFNRGVIQASMLIKDLKNLRVAVEKQAANIVIYTVTWD
jgi:uncharacterized protein (TIGR02265 family)